VLVLLADTARISSFFGLTHRTRLFLVFWCRDQHRVLAMDLSDRLLEPYRSAIVPRILVGMGCRVMTASSLFVGYVPIYVFGDLVSLKQRPNRQ
jgi:hypothetical protein